MTSGTAKSSKEETPTAQFASALSMPLVSGWAARDSIEAISPDRRVHIKVSGEPVEVGTSLDLFAARYRELIASRLPDYEEHDFEPRALLGERACIVHHFSWAGAERPRVTQVQACCISGSRGYLATVTTPAALFPGIEDAIDRLLDAVTIVEHQPTGAISLPLGGPRPTVNARLEIPEPAHDTWADDRSTWIKETVLHDSSA